MLNRNNTQRFLGGGFRIWNHKEHKRYTKQCSGNSFTFVRVWREKETRQRRKLLKLTQKELAMTCGTGLRFIVDLERGKESCQIGKDLMVAQMLGLEIVLTSQSDPGHKERSS